MGLDVYVVQMLSFFWEKTSLFPVPCLSSELLGCSFHWFYDALLEYSASPVGLDRFDPFYSSWKGFHDAGFQKALAETACWKYVDFFILDKNYQGREVDWK